MQCRQGVRGCQSAPPQCKNTTSSLYYASELTGCGRAMATAELAVLVLALTSGNANARRGLTATASLYDADRTLGAFLGARTSRNLRTEGVTSAHRFATQLCEAVAVRVGVALTVGEATATRATSGAMLI